VDVFFRQQCVTQNFFQGNGHFGAGFPSAHDRDAAEAPKIDLFPTDEKPLAVDLHRGGNQAIRPDCVDAGPPDSLGIGTQ
jgi:hypothetical protein